MSEENKGSSEESIQEFLDNWTNDPLGAKAFFLECKETLDGAPGVTWEFVPRPSITYSLRAESENLKEKPVFAAIDVIDDDPANRWLSVCCRAELVTDPDGLGDWVPDGFFGEDAMCFNMDEDDPRLKNYILQRVNEVIRNAANSR